MGHSSPNVQNNASHACEPTLLRTTRAHLSVSLGQAIRQTGMISLAWLATWSTTRTGPASPPSPPGTPLRTIPSNVKNLADGSTPSVATGMPYFYISPMDLSSIDLEVNPQASLSFTLA